MLISSPNDYNNDGDWNGRTLIENSKAIKCPTIAYHLAGTKKVQQALAAPGALERFLNPEIPEEKNAIDLIRSVFAGLYSLDYKEGGWDHDQLALFEKVRSHPEHFVMKPQREGGGNNIYGVDIVTALNSMTPEELSAYILMERINTPSQLAILVRNSMWIEVIDIILVFEKIIYELVFFRLNVCANWESLVFSWVMVAILFPSMPMVDILSE